MSSRHCYCCVKKIRETMVEIIVEPFDDRVASSPRLLAGSRGSAFERRATCFVPYIYVCFTVERYFWPSSLWRVLVLRPYEVQPSRLLILRYVKTSSIVSLVTEETDVKKLIVFVVQLTTTSNCVLLCCVSFCCILKKQVKDGTSPH